MKTIYISIFSLMFLCSCGSSGLESDNNEGNSESKYWFDMQSEDISSELSGIETEWNIGPGIVVLGPEETGEPLGRLELTLGATNEENEVSVDAAILSWSNVRTGTASEIDARLYILSGTGPTCMIDSINAANIDTGVRFCVMDMERIDSVGAGEIISVAFYFNATDAE